MDLILDPTGAFRDVTPSRLLNALGILPHWAAMAETEYSSVREAFENEYQYGVYPMTGGTFEEDGTYQYPEDPPLKPIAYARVDDECIYFYEHAMVAIHNNEGWFLTRMD